MWTLIVKTHEESIRRRREQLEHDRKWIEGIREKELQTFPTCILVEGNKSKAMDLFNQYFGFEPSPDRQNPFADFSEGTTWHIVERGNDETLGHITGAIRGCKEEYNEAAMESTYFDEMVGLDEFLKQKDVLILTFREITR